MIGFCAYSARGLFSHGRVPMYGCGTSSALNSEPPRSCKMSSTSIPTFYNGWFCPFAQRAWLALLEKGVQFSYVEQDPYNKTPEWLAVNPRGLVPAIVHNGKAIYESPVCIEYVDEAWKTDKQLLPSDPYGRAWVRILSDHISKKLVPSFYGILIKKEEKEREEAAQKIIDGLKTLFSDFESSVTGGPFFGGESLNMVDIMLAPFAYRFHVILGHYRNFNIPSEGQPELVKYHQWYTALMNNETFKKTLPTDEQKLIEVYQRYADGSASSLVGDAIRKGTSLP